MYDGFYDIELFLGFFFKGYRGEVGLDVIYCFFRGVYKVCFVELVVVQFVYY